MNFPAAEFADFADLTQIFFKKLDYISALNLQNQRIQRLIIVIC
jgi:hypothetical protein